MAMKMSEAELQEAVMAAAQQLGWRRAHFRPAMTKHGWRTPVSGDGKGFPDLLLVKGDRLLVVELKAEKGVVSDEQKEWFAAFNGVPCVEVYLWQPADWLNDTVANVLMKGRPTA